MPVIEIIICWQIKINLILSSPLQGPYSSRSPNIQHHIAGVLTNPNCEYECNYIPIYTLALWSHSNTKHPSIHEHGDTNDEDRKSEQYETFLNELDTLLTKTNFSAMMMPDNQIVYDMYANDALITYLAVKKWKKFFYSKQSQIDEEQFYNTTVKADDNETTVIEIDNNLSTVNLNTKQKARLDAINSLKLSNNNGQKKFGKLGVSFFFINRKQFVYNLQLFVPTET